MTLNPIVEAVTARIIERSRGSRGRYLELVAREAEKGLRKPQKRSLLKLLWQSRFALHGEGARRCRNKISGGGRNFRESGGRRLGQ